MPLASTVNRALELIVQDCILAAGNDSREPFPYDMAEVVALDTRLMQLIDTGAFHSLGADLEEEWLDMLREARDQA